MISIFDALITTTYFGRGQQSYGEEYIPYSQLEKVSDRKDHS